MKSISVKSISIAVGVLAIVAMLLFSGGFGMNLMQNGSKTEAAATSVKKVSVDTQIVKTVEKASNLKFKSTLEPSEEGIVTSSLAGKTIKILFKEGDYVNSGTPLVLIDDREYKTQLKTSEISLKKLRIADEAAKREVVRIKELLSTGSATQVELEAAERAVEVNQLEMESITATMEGVSNTLSNTVIKSPLAGVVDNKEIKIGQYLSPGMVVTKVKDISTLNAIVQVDQLTAQKIKVGQVAQLSVEGIKDSVVGKVVYVDVSANPETRTFKCKIQVDNSKRLMKPGVYATVEVKSTGVRKVVEIPVTAVMGNQDQYSVFVNNQGVARKVPVTMGDMGSDTVEILSGLKTGDVIIVSNLTVLQDGDPVLAGASTAKAKGE